jgi:hypothetical protein
VTVGSSIPLEGGLPAPARRYPVMAGALVQFRPSSSLRVAAGGGICQEAGNGAYALVSARASGPGISSHAGSALVIDGCLGRESLVRANASVGLR